MTKAKLKEKSEAEQVAFPNLLAEYLLEELLWLISDSEYAGHLWLKNPQILERKQKQDEDEALFLDFVYLTEEQTIKSGKMKPGQKISLKLAYMMLLAFLNKEKTPNIKWKGKAILKENGVEYEITGEFEEMIVPLRIRITELGEQSRECSTRAENRGAFCFGAGNYLFTIPDGAVSGRADRNNPKTDGADSGYGKLSALL